MSYADLIEHERRRAHELHGDKSMEGCDPLGPRPLRILVEEVGEVAKVQNEFDLGKLTEAEALKELMDELVQVGAMASAFHDAAHLRWIEAMGGDL